MIEELEQEEAFEAWKAFAEERQSAITSTDTPKILGLSRYGSALTVYRDKTEPPVKHPPSLPAWLGLRLQRLVGELYATATGAPVRADNRFHLMADRSWIGTHLDFRRRGQPEVLVECKIRAWRRGWGEDGSTDIPADIWTQAQHEMLATGAQECHVATLFSFTAFAVYPIKRDPEFLERTLPILDSLWHDNIVPRIPPPPSGHEADARILRQRYPEDDGQLRAVGPEQEVKIKQLLLAAQNLTSVTTAFEAAKQVVQEMIGDAAGVTGSFGKITWKRSRDSESVDWKLVAEAYDGIIATLLEMANPGDDAELVARLAAAQVTYDAAVGLYTVTKPGSRRFIMDVKEGGA